MSQDLIVGIAGAGGDGGGGDAEFGIAGVIGGAGDDVIGGARDEGVLEGLRQGKAPGSGGDADKGGGLIDRDGGGEG